jgi:C1A family cysteine protease
MYLAKHIYKLKKDKEDLRDFSYTALVFKRISELPKKIDLREQCSPIVNQGNLGSCTANAIVSGLREYLLIQNKQKLVFLSRLFLYYEERKIENTIDEDSGAELRDGMKVLNKLGTSPEQDYPYIIQNFRNSPTRKAIKDAVKYEITSYNRIWDLDSLKVALAEKNPVVCGIKVYQSFESNDVAKTGIIPMPKQSEQFLGGHAVLAVGYNDKKQLIILRNSWGTEWGDKGYFYMPYKVFIALIMDMWTGTTQIIQKQKHQAKTSKKKQKVPA